MATKFAELDFDEPTRDWVLELPPAIFVACEDAVRNCVLSDDGIISKVGDLHGEPRHEGRGGVAFYSVEGSSEEGSSEDGVQRQVGAVEACRIATGDFDFRCVDDRKRLVGVLVLEGIAEDHRFPAVGVAVAFLRWSFGGVLEPRIERPEV